MKRVNKCRLICILQLNPKHPYFVFTIHAFIFLFLSHTPCLIKRSILVNNCYFLGFSDLRIFMFFLFIGQTVLTLSSKTSRKILWFSCRILVQEGITSGFSTFFSRNIQWDFFTKPIDALLIIRSSVKYYNKSVETPA